MRRILLSSAVVLAAAVGLVLATAASGGSSGATSYRIEFDNAFGLVVGADFKVSGVPAGTISSISLDQKTLHAVVKVQLTPPSYATFRSDAFCESRPESLIGEYFVDCSPGRSGAELKPNSVIPASHTQSTIAADLVQDALQLPYRQRLSLIINELGAAVAGRTEDLRTALRRAVPAVTQADNLLTVLAENRTTLRRLSVNANAVVGALAANQAGVRRFIVEANNTATASATQQASISATLQQLPAFLEQLRPALAQLDAASQTNIPALVKLRGAAAGLDRLFTDLPGFARASLPAIRSLGQASLTGRPAVTTADPAVRHLAEFARPTPELAGNLAIVLSALDDRSRAVERDSRSPGGRGYTGLEALLQYAFNQTLAANVFGPNGHMLTSDAFLDPECTFYASAATVALSLAKYGASYRRCYSWLGPNQPGVTTPDPSNPRACVPDPGGAPPGQRGMRTSVCRLTASEATRELAKAPVAGSTPTDSGYVPKTQSVAAVAASPGSGDTTPGSSPPNTAALLRYLMAP